MGETAAMLLWSVAALVATGYCFAKAIGDIRQRRFLLGAAGIVAGATFLLMPIQTHAVKIELPMAAATDR